MGVWNKLPNTQKYATLVSFGKQDIADIIDQLNLWNTLTPKEIKAVAKGDTSSLIAAIDKANDWNRLTLGQLEAIVKDKASAGLVQAMIKAGEWNGLSIEEKTAIMQTKGKSDLADMVVKYGLWNSLPNSTKSLLMNDTDARTKLEKAGVAIDQYNLFKNPNTKHTTAKDDSVGSTIANVKKIIEEGNNVNPTTKHTKATDDSVGSTIAWTNSLIANHNTAHNPNLKHTKATDDSVAGVVGGVNAILDDHNRNHNPVTKHTKAQDNSSSIISHATSIWKGFGGSETVNKTVNFFANGLDAIKKMFKATGDSNFIGGLAVVNDAPSTRYKEVVTLPNGVKFVAQGRNVALPLPRHTKIETAMQSARNYSIPRFAGGTTDFGGAANRINQLNPQTFVTSISSGSNSRVEDLLARLIELTTYQISNPSVPEGKVVLDNGREVGRWLYPTINKLKNRDTIMSNRRRGIF